MAAEIPVRVDTLKITGTRLSASVILGANRINTVLDTRHDSVQTTLDPLLKVIEDHVKSDIAEQLEFYLSPGVKSALRP